LFQDFGRGNFRKAASFVPMLSSAWQELQNPDNPAADPEEGFLLLEDLGDQSFSRLLRAHPEREREIYLAATEALVAMVNASATKSDALAASLPPYDAAVYRREVALFADWFLPQIGGLDWALAHRADFLARWDALFAQVPLKQKNNAWDAH
jgi:aminoglycoside/choline kinase family phosphotransferase